MKSSHVKEAIKLAVKAGTPLYLWGAPGVGKSDTIRAAASELQLEIRDARAVLLDPTDLRGLPAVDGLNKQVNWIPPAFLPRDGSGILFLDELNAAPPLVEENIKPLIDKHSLQELLKMAGW
jgi:MoxR-like ATPase